MGDSVALRPEVHWNFKVQQEVNKVWQLGLKASDKNLAFLIGFCRHWHRMFLGFEDDQLILKRLIDRRKNH